MNIMNTQVPLEGLDDADRFAGLKPSVLNDSEKESVIELATRVLAATHRPGRVLCGPQETQDFLRLKLARRRNEVFGCLFLDTRLRIIAIKNLFEGTIDGASVYPRVAVQQAMEMNVAAVVFYHNHPSGVGEPSHADEAITRRLTEALSLVDARVLDHIVLATGESVSLELAYVPSSIWA